jgi:hypothetical protein
MSLYWVQSGTSRIESLSGDLDHAAVVVAGPAAFGVTLDGADPAAVLALMLAAGVRSRPASCA